MPRKVAAAAGAVVLTGALAFVATSGDGAERATVGTLAAGDPVTADFDCPNAAYVDQALPTNNFGTATTLQINGSATIERRSYMECPVTLPMGAVVDAASLQFWVVTGADSSFQIKNATAAFDESLVNWNNKPNVGAAVIAERNLVGTSGTFVTIAVTDVVGTGNYRYALVPKSTGTLPMSVASDDDTTPARRPILKVTYRLPDVRALFFASPLSGKAALTVKFNDASIGASGSSYAWNFGDGGTSTAKSPTHTFASPGIYWVTLTVDGVSTTGQYVTAEWTTIVDDKFEVAGLPSHWTPYNGPFGSGSANCATPGQVQVPGDGSLHLVMQYSETAVCNGSTGAWLTGGMQINSGSGKRSDTGGNQAIEVRFRIIRNDTSNTVRSHYNIPMHWPTTGSGYGGEADYCEGGATLDTCTTFLHYDTGPPTVSKTHTGIDLSNWTTIRAERLNRTVKVYFNGVLMWNYVGDVTTLPDKVLAGVVQQECPNAGCPSSSMAAFTEDIQIDYIKIQNPT